MNKDSDANRVIDASQKDRTYGSSRSINAANQRLLRMTMPLLQAEAFAHQALEAGFVEQVVGEFFVGEHGEGGAFGAGGEFGGFFDGEAGVLADHGGDHADHDLQAADQAGFVVGCGIRVDIEVDVFS